MQISPEKRDALIRIVTIERVTIKDAAERLGIKYSAAKSIVKIFRDTGRALKLTKKRPIINVIQINGYSPELTVRPQALFPQPSSVLTSPTLQTVDQRLETAYFVQATPVQMRPDAQFKTLQVPINFNSVRPRTELSPINPDCFSFKTSKLGFPTQH